MTLEGVEEGTHIATTCPGCQPGHPVTHEILKPAHEATVRCLECGHVHKTTVEEPGTVDRRVVVSSGGDSESTDAAVPTDETLAVGEEFVVTVDGDPVGVRITSLERGDGKRTEQAQATDIRTIWTRAVDNVGINATVHPADGRREDTRSETYYLPGDAELIVGEPIPALDDTVVIEGLVLTDDAIGYAHEKLKQDGDTAQAKDVKRLYARTGAGDDWRSPWE